MYEYDLHSHISMDRFITTVDDSTQSTLPCSTRSVCDTMLKNATISMTYENWREILRAVNKVHEHVCRHSTYSDMRTPLQRNERWKEQTRNYLSTVISQCPYSAVTSIPFPSRLVSLASLNWDVNDVICMDHMFLDKIIVIHMMDVATRSSAKVVIDSTSM